MLSSVLFLLIAGSAAAADETAPIVDVPEDVVGADVIVFYGDAYDFDASASTDDTGIVSYQWDFEDGGNPVMRTSTTGKTTYTFSNYGQTWVTVHAWDAAGNEGLGWFSIDVVEVITDDTQIDGQTGVVPHSLYFDNADLEISNSQLYFDDGAGSGPGGQTAGLPDTLGESLTPGGDLPGEWGPYYYWTRYRSTGDMYYGEPSFDTDYKLTGDGAIKVGNGRYHYGFEYHFTDKVDLTGYNALTFYLHTNYPSDYNRMYYVYFYGDHSYSSTYGYGYQYAGCLYQGGYSLYRGWHGYTVPLDVNNFGRFYMYNMNDLSSIACIRIYMYSIYNNYNYGYDTWVDCVSFRNAEWGDSITESTSPGGDYAGYWSGNTVGLSSESIVGDYSVRFRANYRSYTDMYYYFNSPQDMSQFNSLRLFLLCLTSSGGDVNYNYYWPYSAYYNLYVYDNNGRYCYYRAYSSTYTYYTYEYSYPGPNYGGRWYAHNLPWGEQTAYGNTGVDFTQIRYFRLANFYHYYTYPSSTSYVWYHLDGLEWLAPGGGGGVKTDKVPYAIYMDGGDLTIDDNSMISGMGSIGARVVSWGGFTHLTHATFDNMWHTEYPGVVNGLGSYGGVEIYGDARIDNTVFTNCAGTGLALYDGDWTVDQDTVDLTGTTLKVKQAPMMIMGATHRSTGNFDIDVTGWALENSPSGTGLLISLEDTSAQVTVTISGNQLDGNAFAGIVVSNSGGGVFNTAGLAAGTSADLDLVIKDQVVDRSGSYGIVYYAGGAAYDPNVWGTILIENVTVTYSGEAGLGMWLDMGGVNVDATIIDSTFERNSGVGAGFMFTSFFGECRLDITNSSFMDNADAGLFIQNMMEPYYDDEDHMISPVSQVEITINDSAFQSNSGWGIVEDLNAMETPDGGVAPPWAWTGPTRTTLWYNLTMTDSQVLENQAGGWNVYPNQGWYNANQVTNRKVIGSTFTDNRGPAMYIEPNHDVSGGGSVSDVTTLDTCRVLDNSAGVAFIMGSDALGYTGELNLYDTRVTGNDREALIVDGPWGSDGIYRWGYSQILGLMVHIDGCHFNSPVSLNMLGADDSNRGDWEAFMGLQFTNNNVDIDEGATRFYLGAYPNCEDFTAWADIGGNRFFRGFVDNGIHLEMFGGYSLEMDATIHDQVIDGPLGSGVHIAAGTLAYTTEPHQIDGKVVIDNVSIEDALSNGINFTVGHREQISAKSLAMLEVHDVYMENVGFGILANDIRGAVYDTVIVEPRAPAVYLVYCTFDFFSCELGPVETTNIVVLTKGAARLWYDLGVDVKWASGNRVLGAVVSVQDNTWSTIAVNTVVSNEVLPIGYVNSYTVLPDSVYSKSPFLLTGTYLGLTTEKMVDVQGNIIVDLVLTDDVLPRLTVNAPLDGSNQRDTSMLVKGHAWDQHSGLQAVMISIDDGQNWVTATGAPEFEYMFDEVPEGNLMVMVKAMDHAGNERMEIITVLVDVTPPPIIIIEPENDVILTQDPVLSIVGVTERGATVLVNNEIVALDLTLFRTTLTLDEGMNEVRIRAIDRLGNSAVHVIKVELDTIAPPLIVTSPMAGDVLGERTVHVEGQTEEDATVYIDGQMAANQLGDFSHTIVLGEGPNVLMVTSEDMAGNMATVLLSVSVDTTAPWLELASPMDGDVFGAEGISVMGWVELGSIVKVNDQVVEVVDSHFSVSIMGSEGENNVVVTVIDRAGNEHSENVEVWFDTSPPTIELVTPRDGLMTSDETIEVMGQIHWNEDRESFRDITLTINGDFAPFAADGEFHIQYELVEGTNPLFIRATDDVGNYKVHTVTVTRDSMAPFLLVEPTPTFDHPTWDKPSTYNNMVYIEGVTEPGAIVTVDGAGVEVDEAGRFNVSILLDPVPEGDELVQRSVLVVATDAAGNSKEETVEVYRLKEEVTDPGFMDYDSAQYWVLFLSIVILVVAIVAAAFLWRRIGASEEEENLDDVCLVSLGDLEEV